MHLKSRPAKVADKLVVKNFGSGTTGFADISEKDMEGRDCTAVCVLPGTELAFSGETTTQSIGWFGEVKVSHPQTARFRQVDIETSHAHHDALEFADGKIVKLTTLTAGQTATVLQLPAAPKSEQEAKEQTRLEVVA